MSHCNTSKSLQGKRRWLVLDNVHVIERGNCEKIPATGARPLLGKGAATPPAF